MLDVTKKRLLVVVMACLGASACSGDGNDDASLTANDEVAGRTAAAQSIDLPSSLGFGEYNSLRDALDNDEVPQRIVPRLARQDRLHFDSQKDAANELVNAIADGDFEEADRVFASVPEAWRRELMYAADDAAADAIDGYNYAEAYRFDRYLNVDSAAFWMLDSEYVQGRVADKGTGAPVAGATVSVSYPHEQTTQTGADGEFRVLLPPNASSDLMVEHADYDSKRVFNTNSGAPISLESLSGETLEILMGTGYPKLTFRGRIVDATTGQALASIPVIAGFDPIEGATELNIQLLMGKFVRETDADGRFEITELPVRDVHLLVQSVQNGQLYHFQQEGFRFEEGTEHVFEIEGSRAQLEVPMVVVGTVKDRTTGNPVANARVSAGGWKAERTDANGRFMMQLDTGEDWQLTASHDEYHQSQPQPFASARPQTIETEFLLDPITTGTILGTAINAVTGEPIVNAVIEIAGQRVRTDSQGRFRADEIESGEVMVSGAQSGYRADSESLLLEALQTAEATLKLEPITTGTISGVVIEAGSGDALAGAAVSAGDKQVITGDDGLFVLEDVEAGAISVGASKSLHLPGSSDVLLEAMGSVETRIELEPITWGTVRGQVRDAATGQTLVNATVQIGAITVRTDSNGDYVAERVPAGRVSIGAQLARYRDGQASIDLPRDGNIEQLLELAPITTGTVFVTVVDAMSGEPVGDAAVAIGQLRNDTDVSGQVVVEEIPAGRIVVNANKRLYEPGSAEAVLDAAGESRLKIELIPITYGTIAGTVVDSASGAPLANATVSFAGFQLRTDAKGTFRSERVPAGSISVSAELFRYRGDQETLTLERGAAQHVKLQLEQITTGTVRGIVRNAADGEPVNGAMVTIGNLSARSNAEGRFEIEQVAAGDLTVRASLALFETGGSTVNVEAAAAVDTEIVLTPITYGTVSGHVVDADTGEPLAGAIVSAGRQSTRTNASGEFELQRVAAGDISVAASKAVYLDNSMSMALDAGASETVSLRLKAITWGTITGVVTDAETRRPLANAEIVVATKALRSDSAGRFHVEKVPAGTLRVSGTMPAYEPGSVTAKLEPDTERDVSLSLIPIKIGDISGTVLDAKTGEPIAQARVTSGRLSAETDTAGRFGFESVPTGANAVAARHPDYADGSVTADVPPAETVSVVIRLELRREDVTNLEAELARSGTIDLYGIYFDSGKAQFKPSSLQTLRAVLEVMKRAPDRRFRIAGHTDSDGGDDYNQDLSERRANTVIDWLVDRGIEARRLDGAGFGETRPAAPNNTESGKALNRRVQLSFAD